jgi:hypothetical protein
MPPCGICPALQKFESSIGGRSVRTLYRLLAGRLHDIYFSFMTLGFPLLESFSAA